MAPEADSAGEVDQRDLEGPLVNWRDKGHLVELDPDLDDERFRLPE